MLQAETKQFSLADDGRIFYQVDATNPLPGVAVAHVCKGDELLRPDVVLDEHEIFADLDRTAALEKLRAWLDAHIKTVLEPLFGLEAQEGEGVDDAVRGISAQLHEALGIKERADLENLIAQLTPDSRRALRSRRVRLGPVLIFMPDLNKPAAVRLRASLWSLWQDKALPADIPPAGMTSLNIVDKDIDKDFYRAIGYPVYGPRAVRIDMLDRVMNAIYDSAKNGQFQARHDMAEWLGCSIPDLYAVLEAMGHTKIETPEIAEAAPEASAESVEQASPTEEKVEEKPEAARPVLASFRLRKGKAYEGKRPVQARPKSERDATKPNKPAQKSFAESRRDKGKKDARPANKKHGSSEGREPRVMSTGPKLENNPFAILKQLQTKE